MQVSTEGAGTWIGRSVAPDTVILRLREFSLSPSASGLTVGVDGTIEGTVAPTINEHGTSTIGLTFQSPVPITGTILVGIHQASGSITGTTFFTRTQPPSMACSKAEWLLAPPRAVPPQ